MTKQAIRTKYRSIRSHYDETFRHQAANVAASHFLQHPQFTSAQRIACYASCGSEFVTNPLIQTIWQARKICYLPILTDNNTLQFIQYNEGDALQKNQHSILQPVDTVNTITVKELDVVILPLLAFDSRGNRVGAGGGYYDRTFEFVHSAQQPPFLLGLAFAAQECENIAAEAWDIKLNGVLTELEFRLF